MKTLPYADIYYKLKDAFSSGLKDTFVPVLDIEISRREFSSNTDILPGRKSYCCGEHNISFNPENHSADDPHHTGALLELHDSEIDPNSRFNYIIIRSTELPNDFNRVIVLFHGLNEKKWDKYLPWAYALCKMTAKPVILFPLAFHMDRAPAEWSNNKAMAKEASRRISDISGNSHASFVNAAISERLANDPERFFWSGLESFNDINELLSSLNLGSVPGFRAGTKADLFGYSIGAYFGLILLMANSGGLLNDSKLFTFCGGATLDRMYPISRYIMDAKAATSINSYYLELMNGETESAGRIGHYLNSTLHPFESIFKLMLLYHHNKTPRETLLRELEKKIYAVPLKQDTIVPPAEVLNTLKGEMRDINIKVEIEDFPYPYNHVTPFLLSEKYKDETSDAFTRIMNKAAGFLES